MHIEQKRHDSMPISLASYGETYTKILYYFLPELVTAFLLYSLPMLLDEYFIANLKSTATYATLGNTNNFIHFITKISEGISVGTIIMVGQYNGRHEYQRAGRALRDAFWMSLITGFVAACTLYFFAGTLYYWYGAPAAMVAAGLPFLRLRAVAVFLMFLYFACVGFLRGIKNTRIPMATFVLGTFAFIVCDYIFIKSYGMGLQGSAAAAIVQYIIMVLSVLGYLFWSKECRPYAIQLFSIFNGGSQWTTLISLSWPVVIDKAVMAFAYILLGSTLTRMGTVSSATFCIVKNMERFAILPAVALAQIVTFLVSNELGKKNMLGVMANIRKVLLLASFLVVVILGLFAAFSGWIIGIYDKTGDFIGFASRAFPLLAPFIFFDMVQLILSASLRGLADVKTVMMTRIIVFFCYFLPLSQLLSRLTISSELLKFVLVYGAFYSGNGLMSIGYVWRLLKKRVV